MLLQMLYLPQTETDRKLRAKTQKVPEMQCLNFGLKKEYFQRQFSSVAQSCPSLCEPMDCSTPGLPVYNQLPEFTQIHVHWIGDGIQPSHPLSSPSPPASSLSKHQGLLQWVSSLHQAAKVLEFQLQRQSFQWIFRTWTVWKGKKESYQAMP